VKDPAVGGVYTRGAPPLLRVERHRRGVLPNRPHAVLPNHGRIARPLTPVLQRAADLAPRQRQALLGAFGLTDESVAVDQLLISIASLTLLSGVSERSTLLVVIDDAHRLDASSLDVLAFVARRLDRERIVLIVSARGESPPRGFDRGFSQLRLEPLSLGDAHRLLDTLPHFTTRGGSSPSSCPVVW
jgi:predicted ATPase